jgi:hypothetical protein
VNLGCSEIQGCAALGSFLAGWSGLDYLAPLGWASSLECAVLLCWPACLAGYFWGGWPGPGYVLDQLGQF